LLFPSPSLKLLRSFPPNDATLGASRISLPSTQELPQELLQPNSQVQSSRIQTDACLIMLGWSISWENKRILKVSKNLQSFFSHQLIFFLLEEEELGEQLSS
jgi:hypothetical protein